MRFACQSCGKAYNLPEERIAEKSNVKLKCRVCGAIVEVKRQGELVAHLLDEAEDRRMARVSEAPAPLTSISPEDDDPDGATVSISEASINDRGPLELEIPGAAATGFSAAAAAALSSAAVSSAALSSAALSSPGLLPGALSSAGSSSSALSSEGFSSAGLSSSAFSPPPLTHGEAAGRMDASQVAPPLPPPPLSPSSLPPPPPLRTLDAAATELVKNGSAGNGAAISNGAAPFFPDGASEPDDSLTPELKAPVAPAVSGSPVSSTLLGASPLSPDLSDFPATEGAVAGKDPMFKIKMLAAFATGVLIDRIISGLFQ